MQATHPTWTLDTRGDPLAAVRQFLRNVFDAAGLDQLLARGYEANDVHLLFLDDPAQLAQADPFAPVMRTNAAQALSAYRHARPDLKLGAVLRACETRALAELTDRGLFDPAGILLIGVDCLGTLPVNGGFEDADLPAQTAKALQFARQGGVAMYRCRPACQMCPSPLADPPDAADGVDISISVIGLPVNEVVFVSARAETAQQLGLAQLTNGPADPALVAQRARTTTAMLERRSRARQRITGALEGDLALDVAALAAHLNECETCQDALNTACPVCSLVPLAEPEGVITQEAVVKWLTNCAGCGMCDQAVSGHLPLSAIFGRIQDHLQAEVEALG